jgi:hypothetical protein
VGDIKGSPPKLTATAALWDMKGSRPKLTATGALGAGRIDLNWQPPTWAVDGFHVYRSSDGGVTWPLRATVADANMTTWYEEGLPDGGI